MPASAQPVLTEKVIGQPGAGSGPSFFAQACQNGLLTIVTTATTVYAELPCDRALPDSAVHRFLAQSVRIRVSPATSSKLYLESAVAGTVEFTVGGVWIVER